MPLEGQVDLWYFTQDTPQNDAYRREFIGEYDEYRTDQERIHNFQVIIAYLDNYFKDKTDEQKEQLCIDIINMDHWFYYRFIRSMEQYNILINKYPFLTKNKAFKDDQFLYFVIDQKDTQLCNKLINDGMIPKCFMFSFSNGKNSIDMLDFIIEHPKRSYECTCKTHNNRYCTNSLINAFKMDDMNFANKLNKFPVLFRGDIYTEIFKKNITLNKRLIWLKYCKKNNVHTQEWNGNIPLFFAMVSNLPVNQQEPIRQWLLENDFPK